LRLCGNVAIADGRSDVLGMESGTSKTKPIRMEFLPKLTGRGLRGINSVISDAHANTPLASAILLEGNDRWTDQ